MVRVTEIPLNTEKQVVDITAESAVRARLLELGISPGRSVKVARRLPFNGPLVLHAGSLSVALRVEEAEHVWVK